MLYSVYESENKTLTMQPKWRNAYWQMQIYIQALTSTDVCLLSGNIKVLALLPGMMVDPILILGPTNMYRLSPDLYWML